MKFIYILLLLISESPTVFGCSMPEFRVDFVKGIPSGSNYVDSSENIILNFLDTEYGKKAWQDASEAYFFKTDDIAENERVIPITITATDYKNNDAFREVIVFAVKKIDVLSSDSYLNKYLLKFGNKSLDVNGIYAVTNPLYSVEKIAAYKLGDSTLPYISMRVNLLHYPSKAQLFAILVPKDAATPVQVIHRKKRIHLYR